MISVHLVKIGWDFD